VLIFNTKTGLFIIFCKSSYVPFVVCIFIIFYSVFLAKHKTEMFVAANKQNRLIYKEFSLALLVENVQDTFRKRSNFLNRYYWPHFGFVHRHCRTQVSNTRPAGRIWPATSFHVAPDGLKDRRSPFLQEMYETYPVLLFWRFQIKWLNVIILVTFFNGQYFYTKIINH